MFAYFDGDNIGDHIELLLLSDKVEEASQLSNNLNVALLELKNELEKKLNAEIILFGGDDLMILYEEHSDHLEIIKNVRERYLHNCGHSISCGCGDTLRSAVENLRKAKLMGRNYFIYNNQIVGKRE